MKLADSAIDNKVVTLVLTVVILGGGLLAYQSMSRLEDPEFTIKDALVITPYPGATAYEVEEEVTDEIETGGPASSASSTRSSPSRIRGLSTVTVSIKNKYDQAPCRRSGTSCAARSATRRATCLPGPARRSSSTTTATCTASSSPSTATSTRTRSSRRSSTCCGASSLLVQDVAKVETFGERVEAIYVEPSRDRHVAARHLRQTSSSTSCGRRTSSPTPAGSRSARSSSPSIRPASCSAVEDFENQLLLSGGSEQIYLRDVATVRRGYVEPPANLMRYDGRRRSGSASPPSPAATS